MSRAIAVALLLAAAPGMARATTQVHFVMGTLLRVVVDDEVDVDVFAACFDRVRALDRMFSRFDPASELVRLNETGGGPATPAFREVLAHALALRAATDGTFDPSAGAVTGLWRTARVEPGASRVAAARDSVGRVAVDGDRVVLGPGTRLDFDGFAKGVAVDACVEALRRAGVTRALVSFGESSLYGLGAPRGAAAWTLDVRGPDPGAVVARLALRDRAAAVSSVFARGGSSARAHIVDPRTGRPLTDAVASVVVAPSAAEAEAWGKAVLVRGPAGIAAAERTGRVQAARLGRRAVAIGSALRAARTLRVLANARPLEGEVELR